MRWRIQTLPVADLFTIVTGAAAAVVAGLVLGAHAPSATGAIGGGAAVGLTAAWLATSPRPAS